MLNLIGGAYATVTSLSGTGMISLLTSQIYIGQSFFNGSISANSGSVVYLSGVVVNGPIYTDGIFLLLFYYSFILHLFFKFIFIFVCPFYVYL